MRLADKYITTKKNVEKTLHSIPVVGDKVAESIKFSKNVVRDLLLKENTLFSNMGFLYLGPVDGHNIEEIEKAIHAAKKI